MPKGLVPLEELFDNNDVSKSLRVKPNNEDVEDINIGIEHNPKIVKVASKLPHAVKERYIQLLNKNSDVFVWSYKDLKVYDTDVIRHTIPLKENEKPFRHKLRRVNPLLFPLIEKEIKKLFDVENIVSLRHSKWLENVVPVRKKNGEIRICIDFRNLNRVSLKDNYPLPKMDHILQKVIYVVWILRLQSGFGTPRGSEKTTFTTPWGTFMYAKIPFGLMNAVATFERAMDIVFSQEWDKFVVIYLDDTNVYSKSYERHLQHLEHVFLKCRKFGISSSPKKSNFPLEEGKLLGHIISKDCIKIDPSKVQAIHNIEISRTKKNKFNLLLVRLIF